MLGRMTYYFQKARRLARERGLKQSAQASWDFARRRIFSGQLALEAIEYHLLAPGRNIQGTLRRVCHEPLSSSTQSRCRWMLYASFDRDSVIRPHVTRQLQAFAELGYSIIFISTSPALTDEQAQSLLAPWCRAVLHRQNEGYDFASWKLGYERYRDEIRASHPESLILMNDSCLGPYGDIKEMIDRMIAARGSFYGLTKSYEIAEYLQSYFLHFGADLLPDVLDRYMERVRILYSKWAIVRFMEIGLSRWLKESQGVALEAWVDPRKEPAASLMKKHQITDPILAPVASCLRDQGFLPFYKRSNLS